MIVMHRGGIDATKLEDDLDPILWDTVMYIPGLDIGVLMRHDGISTISIYPSNDRKNHLTGFDGEPVNQGSLVRIIKSVNEGVDE